MEDFTATISASWCAGTRYLSWVLGGILMRIATANAS